MAKSRCPLVVVGLALAGVFLPVADGRAQITLDGSLGPAGPLAGPSYVIGSELGQIRGNNLFHSFDQFNVQTGESATFTGPASIANIMGRVTGGLSSSIDGLLDSRTSMPSANLFLVNPSGVLVGPNAVLNVGGAFHASTANYLRFADDAKFFASLSPDSTLTVAEPVAFGFLGPTAASISLDGSNLTVDAQKTLSFAGGDMRVAGATLTAPGGRVQIDGVGSGEVPLQTFDAGSASRRGAIEIMGSTLDVSGDPGGTVVIRGGQLTIDASTLTANTTNVDGAPIGIDLAAAGALFITNGSSLTTGTSGAGRGGDIRLTATDLQLTNGAFVSTATSGTGRGGDIGGSATHGVLLDSGTLIASQTSGEADGGNVSITGDTVTITGGSLAFSLNQSSATGGGGNISVTAQDSISISGTSGIQSEADTAGHGGQVFVSALGSLTMDSGSFIGSVTQFDIGRAGDVTVEAGTLSLASAAAISSTTTSPGHGGDVTVTATGSAQIAGSGTAVSTGSFGDGLPGEVLATFGTLTLTGGALIQSGVFAGNQGGNVTVTATSGPIVISDGSGISSQAFFGDVGRVAISAPEVVIDNGFVSTSTLQSGRAGDISINTQTLTLRNGGQIASSSILEATGAGGDINVTAPQSVTISGTSPTGESPIPMPFKSFIGDASSGLFSTTSNAGRAGSITVTTPNLTLTGGGKLSASSTGSASALAGNLNVTFGDTLFMQGSSITTESLLADGGNITITSTASLLQLSNSQITTSVQSGAGAGGNITLGSHLHPLSFLVLANSAVRADAFGGPGGNIGIFADVYLTSGSLVSASSALSAPGTIDVEARITDLSGSLAQLPDNLLQAANLLRAACAARTTEGKASSLVVAGREGVPPEPEGLLWSPLGASLGDLSAMPSEAHDSELFPQFAGLWFGSRCAR